MRLSLLELEQGDIGFDERFPSKALDLEGTNFRQTGELHVRGTAELLTGTEEIRIHGHIAGELEGDCDRCLEPAPFSVDRDFDLSYRPASAEPGSEETELDAVEADVGYYEGTELAVAEVVREQLVLWLPMHWICSNGCKGICPICGGHRNRCDCGSQQEEQDERWAALRDFRPSK